MTKRTIQEIIDAPDVKVSKEIWDIERVMELVVSEFGLQYYDVPPEDAFTTLGIMSHVKIDVNYDGERGAKLEVLKFNDVPFAVISQAGRGLSDVQDVHIIDQEYALNAVRAWITFEDVDVVDKMTSIDINFWEGIPVDIG